MSVRQDKKVGTWYYRFMRNFRDYYQGGYRTRRQAEDAETLKKDEVIDREVHPESAGTNTLFHDGAQWFFDEYSRKKKADWMGDRAKKEFWQAHLSGKLLSQVQPGHIQAGREALIAQGMSELTANHYHSFVKTVYNRLAKFGHYAGANPAAQLEMVRVESERVRFLYPSEEKVLTPAVKAKKDGVLWPYYFTDMHTGMRLRELWFRVKDVSLVLGHIFVGKTKTRRSRYVPISETLRAPLASWMAGKGPDDYVLGNLHPNTVSHWFTEVCRDPKVDIKDFPFHCIRHTFVANLLANDVALYKVAKIIGDSEKTTEKHYGHLSVSHLRGAIAKIDGVVSPEVSDLQSICSDGDEASPIKDIKTVDNHTILPR